MTKIIGITGSLRSHSYNTALLRAAQALVPDGATLEIATLKGIPLYDGDVEQTDGIPPAVVALKELVAQRGIKELWLEVFSGNESAIKAYEKAGFEHHMIQMRMSVG